MVRGTKNVIVRQRKTNVKQKDVHVLKQEFCAIFGIIRARLVVISSSFVFLEHLMLTRRIFLMEI